jgi:hypothetical protein
MTARKTPDRGGAPGDPDELVIPPEAFAPSTVCDGDFRCGHPACFQIQLEASQPQQAYRQALACAYHVADVVEALRTWAREHDLAGGQLTILAIEPAAGLAIEPAAGLAIEPAAGGRQPGGTSGSKTAALREFAFSIIPLKTIPPGQAPYREPTS